jgi:hypothetical protein
MPGEFIMRRFVALGIVVLLCMAQQTLGADGFDRYINPILSKAPGAPGVKQFEQLTAADLARGEGVLPNQSGALVLVQTNDGRNCKLLLESARQKVDASTSVPILLIDRYVTYRQGQEQTVEIAGQNVSLFDGFRFNLDIGQVVPEQLGGDIRFVVKDGKGLVEPLGKAKLFLLTKPLAEAAPKKNDKMIVGETFEPRFFDGTYKLHSDGRRSGKLTLKVAEDGEVAGSFYSDKDGQKYDVKGKIGTPRHSIQFTIKFPRSVESFQGWLFTGDGMALAGTSRLKEREAGFYALRLEE